MKNLMLSLIMVVCFVAVSSAQQKEVVKEKITKEVKEVKKCDENCTKPCCADKKSEKHTECKDHKHGEAKKCDENCKKECCANKEGKHAECKDKDADGHKHAENDKTCEPGCKKACCADKKLEVKKELTKVKEGVKMTFACPMKCEGDKTYAKEGKCPKCNMNLKPSKS
jgi:hypothetical protein